MTSEFLKPNRLAELELTVATERAARKAAEKRARVFGVVARGLLDALQLMVEHCATHDMQKPPAAETEGSYPPAPTTTHEGTS